MLSKYFKFITNSEKFQKDTKELIETLKEQKVLVYGAGEAFFELSKIYDFKKNLNIVAIADKKFETKTRNITGLEQIPPKQILNENYDKILVSNEVPKNIVSYLVNTLDIPKDKILTIFREEIKDEAINFCYLYKHKFDKTLPKLIKKLNNKKVVLYGAGSYLELIKKYFDLSNLNIIGITDKKFEAHEENETFLGYKVFSINEAINENPDYFIVSTKFYISIIEDLYYKKLRAANIKIKPLVRKSFLTLLKEIWS